VAGRGGNALAECPPAKRPRDLEGGRTPVKAADGRRARGRGRPPSRTRDEGRGPQRRPGDRPGGQQTPGHGGGREGGGHRGDHGDAKEPRPVHILFCDWLLVGWLVKRSIRIRSRPRSLNVQMRRNWFLRKLSSNGSETTYLLAI